MSPTRVSPDAAQDAQWMACALEQAETAAECGEVPVGAVVVANNELIARGYNQVIRGKDPSAHAEIIALRAAARVIDNYRLVECSLYVTLEPCCMCAGAIIHARIKRLVYATDDPKTGACGSVYSILQDPRHNHRVAFQAGVRADAASRLMQDFFRARRGT